MRLVTRIPMSFRRRWAADEGDPHGLDSVRGRILDRGRYRLQMAHARRRRANGWISPVGMVSDSRGPRRHRAPSCVSWNALAWAAMAANPRYRAAGRAGSLSL